MNVLSLFDGMSCGQISLEHAGIHVDNYFASEIDKHAISITQKNYPKTVQLGNVISVTSRILPKIDLLIGGSPCQGFSVAGKKLNFDDPKSILFFEFVRLLEEISPKYFLLENVRMKKEYQNIISEYLGVKPIKINSALVSAQNRVRLYWTNIPNIEQPRDRNIFLKDILEQDLIVDEKSRRKVNLKKYNGEIAINPSNYVTKGYIGTNTKSVALTQPSGNNATLVVTQNGYRKLTPIECERLQCVPDDYTKSVSNTQRYRMLGNGWTVDIITHIFKNIKSK